MSRKCAVFSLVELLVVIAIISILAGMLSPALHNAMDVAKQISCSSNFKQLNISVMCYANDFNGYIPAVNGVGGVQPRWHEVLYGHNYMEQEQVKCPDMSDRVSNWWLLNPDYGMNFSLCGDNVYRKISAQAYPSLKILFFDVWRNASDGTTDQTQGLWRARPRPGASTDVVWFGRPAGRHGDYCNTLYLDGHCDPVKILEIEFPWYQEPFRAEDLKYQTWDSH